MRSLYKKGNLLHLQWTVAIGFHIYDLSIEITRQTDKEL